MNAQADTNAQTAAEASWVVREMHARVIPRQRIGQQLAGISMLDAVG